MWRPPLISTPQQLKEKLQLLDSLADIQIGLEMMKGTGTGGDDDEAEAVDDLNYKSLNCELKALEKTAAVFNMIEAYVSNTNGLTHGHDKLSVLDAYEVSRESDINPSMLLWHGPCLTNWCGILGQGYSCLNLNLLFNVYNNAKKLKVSQ